MISSLQEGIIKPLLTTIMMMAAPTHGICHPCRNRLLMFYIYLVFTLEIVHTIQNFQFAISINYVSFVLLVTA